MLQRLVALTNYTVARQQAGIKIGWVLFQKDGFYGSLKLILFGLQTTLFGLLLTVSPSTSPSFGIIVGLIGIVISAVGMNRKV